MSNFTILEIRESSVLVKDQNDMVFPVAKYIDSDGEYFLNGQMDRQEAIIIESFPEPISDEDYYESLYSDVGCDGYEGEDTDNDVKSTYFFNVEYEHIGRERGFDTKLAKVSAYTQKEAYDKVVKRFKNIFDISFSHKA